MTAADPTSSAAEPAPAGAAEPALRGLSLVRLAGVHAGLCAGLPIASVLQHEGVDVRLWERAEPLWVDKLAEDAEDDGPLQDAYDARLAAARLRYGRAADPLDHDLRAWAAFLRALQASDDPPAFLASTGVRAFDMLRLHAVWSARLADDAALRTRAEAVFSGDAGPLPQITFAESAPQPPPPEGVLAEVPPPVDADEEDEDEDEEDEEEEALAGGAEADDGPPPLWVDLEGWGSTPVRIAERIDAPSRDALAAPTPPAAPPPLLDVPAAPPRPEAGPPRAMPSFLAQAAKAPDPPAPPAPEPSVEITQPPVKSPLAGLRGALPFDPNARAAAPRPADAPRPAARTNPKAGKTMAIPLSSLPQGPALPFAGKNAPPATPPSPSNEPPGAPVEDLGTMPISLSAIAKALPFAGKNAPPASPPSPPNEPPRAPAPGPVEDLGTMPISLSAIAQAAPIPFVTGRARSPDAPAPPANPLPDVTSEAVPSPLKGVVLPFRRDASAAPPKGPAAPAQPGSPAAPPAARPSAPAAASPPGTPGFGSPGALPAGERPPPTSSNRLTIDQYAALCAELSVVPNGAEVAFRRYGLTDLQERLTVDLAWQYRLREDPRELEAWTALFRRWHAYFTEQMKRGGPR